MFTDIQAVVLAAGKSTRLKTGRTKLAEKICGQEIILYATKLLEKLHIPTTMVVGYQKEVVQDIVTTHHKDTISFATQDDPKGTGHALLCTKDSWSKKHILIMNGDMPLVTEKLIEDLWKKHQETNADISFVTAHNEDPSDKSYGRVIEKDGTTHIVEANEFTGDHHEFCCVNAGIYLVNTEFLQTAATTITQNSTTGEFYITDLVKIASDQGKTVTTTYAPFDDIRGVNTFQELWAAQQIKRSEIIKHWMSQGVRFCFAQTVHLDVDISIGAGSTIAAGVHLIHGAKVGKNCFVYPFSFIDNSTLENNVTVHPHSVISNAHIENGAEIGPFANVRDNTTVKENAAVGNFVEVARSIVGKDSKARHLTYLGDTTIGKNVNIGAGTIVCNYDGVSKHTTTIKDNACIGSNNALVAPVTVEEGAFTAAGSVITENVPKDALAIARSRQTNKEGYAKKLRDRQEKKENEVPFIPAVKTTNDEVASE